MRGAGCYVALRHKLATFQKLCVCVCVCAHGINQADSIVSLKDIALLQIILLDFGYLFRLCALKYSPLSSLHHMIVF